MKALRRGVSYAVIAAALLAPLEGYDPIARHRAIDPAGVITWCYGRTNYDDPTVKAGTRFTKAECQQLLVEDVPKYYKPIAKCVRVPLTEHQKAALVSANYNTGRVCRSPMVQHFNAHQPQAACDSFRGWYVRANGVFLRGLANRREAERKVCMTPD